MEYVCFISTNDNDPARVIEKLNVNNKEEAVTAMNKKYPNHKGIECHSHEEMLIGIDNESTIHDYGSPKYDYLTKPE